MCSGVAAVLIGRAVGKHPLVVANDHHSWSKLVAKLPDSDQRAYSTVGTIRLGASKPELTAESELNLFGLNE